MRAVLCRAWGSIDTLTIEDVPAPAPGFGGGTSAIVSPSIGPHSRQSTARMVREDTLRA